MILFSTPVTVGSNNKNILSIILLKPEVIFFFVQLYLKFYHNDLRDLLFKEPQQQRKIDLKPR